MIRPRISLPSARDSTDPEQDVLDAVEAMARIWARYLRAHPEFPKLYGSGVRYEPEIGTEEWLSPVEVFAVKAGDCEDLAIWRLAELWAAGQRACAVVEGRRMVGGYRQHVFIGFPDGATEDPSLKLLPEGTNLS